MFDKALAIRDLERSLNEKDPVTGERLIRVTLSDESTDISDLIGWDLSNMRLKRKDRLRIIIRTDNPSQALEDSIRDHYARLFIDQRRLLKVNAVKALSMLATGVGLLFLRMILIRKLGDFLLSESILVSSWVFTWEAIAQVCFERPELRHLQKQNRAVLDSQIEFTEG